jgi:hypothetical protein
LRDFSCSAWSSLSTPCVDSTSESSALSSCDARSARERSSEASEKLPYTLQHPTLIHLPLAAAPRKLGTGAEGSGATPIGVRRSSAGVRGSPGTARGRTGRGTRPPPARPSPCGRIARSALAPQAAAERSRQSPPAQREAARSLAAAVEARRSRSHSLARRSESHPISVAHGMPIRGARVPLAPVHA